MADQIEFEKSDSEHNELLLIAGAHHRNGRLDAADELYRQVLALDPRHARALMLKGVLERERGDLSLSLELLQQADQATAQRDPEIAAQLAVSLMATNQLAAADAALRRALAIDPEAPQTLANLGALLQHRGLLREAAEIDRRYLTLLPDDLEVHCNLANCLSEAGQGDEALSEIEAVLARFPDHAQLLATRGAVLCASGLFAQACETLEQALERKPGDELALINLAFAHRQLGNAAAAIDALKSAVRNNPDNARATADLANIFVSEGHAEMACQTCENFLLYHPGERLVLGTYPYALRVAGREREADELLDYAQFVRVTDLDPVADDETLEDFNRALANALRDHASLIDEPVSKSTFGGAQTGELDSGALPALVPLTAKINAQVREFVADCTARGLADHPALFGVAERWSLRIWGTVLRSGGYQTPHLHPLAWLSGVYYVELPQDLRVDSKTAGWLEFGPPPERVVASAPQHLVEPRAGRLVLFPSFFYHGTRPFTSAHTRISVAFDVMPIPA